MLVVLTLVTNLFYVGLVVFTNANPPDGGGDLLWLLAAAMVPVVVAQRLARHRQVRLQTVMGAVAAYLQIAVAFASLYLFLDVLTTGPFFADEERTTAYMYASLQTITTLGYGDLAPGSDLGRLAMVSEAVVGQVFLVTFVALIVSRFAAYPPMDEPDS